MFEKNICKADRTVSIVAFWLALVNSSMTRHKASDNGVNCPWFRSSTTQSSTSPATFSHNDKRIDVNTRSG